MCAPKPISTIVAVLAASIAILAVPAAPAFAAAPEAPATTAATAITGTTATLEGILNPGASATVGYEFAYSPTETCTEGALVEPEPGVERTGKAIHVQLVVTELIPLVKYTVCLISLHGGQQAIGNQETFTTEEVAPTVEALTATSLSPFAELLEGQVNAENAPTQCKFEYGTDAAADEHEVTCDQGASLEGFGAQPATATVTGLESSTTYHYKLAAKDGAGKADVAGEFTTATAEAPTVASESVAGLTSTDAQLEAKVNPNFQETSYLFEYSTSEAALLKHEGMVVPGAPPAPDLAAVSEEQVAGPVDIGSHLTPGTTYFYRVVATNSTGTTDGTATVQSFTTLDVPIPVTGEAANVTSSEVTFTGTINPAGAETTYYVEYISEAGYQAALAERAPNPYTAGATTVDASAPVGYGSLPAAPLTAVGLQPGTSYHYALVASNSVGTVTGQDRTFTAPGATPPLVTTGEATNISQGTATLTGTVDSRGLATSVTFEFGTVPLSGAFQGAIQMTGSSSPTEVSFTFNGYLTAGTKYFYRVVATNADGRSEGAERSFTTAPFPNEVFPSTPLLSTVIPFEAKTTLHGAKPRPKLSNAEKLAKALKSCRRDNKSKRVVCERRAHNRYGAKTKQKKVRK